MGALGSWSPTPTASPGRRSPSTSSARSSSRPFLPSRWSGDRPLLAVGLGPGLLGGFTTLSAYAEQGRALAADGHPARAGVYLLGTLVACVAAVHLATGWSTASARAEFEEEEGDE